MEKRSDKSDKELTRACVLLVPITWLWLFLNRYAPAEGEDARMIAFDIDFEEWGFYNGTEVAQESLILHGAQFEARVPQEVEAWYCDWKVCEVSRGSSFLSVSSWHSLPLSLCY